MSLSIMPEVHSDMKVTERLRSKCFFPFKWIFKVNRWSILREQFNQPLHTNLWLTED